MLKKKRTSIIHALCISLGLSLLLSPINTMAESVEDRIVRQRAMTIESNEINNWPSGPVVTAESAILMDADTGVILYEKNIHQKQYPASTTKILTTLIIAENCTLDERVTFSKTAVFDTPRDSNHIAMDVGQELTIEDCLNAILIRSANEVCFACAEHITGTTWQDFGEIMNQRAAELGCVDSHFVNPNGLPDPEHYTSAYDLAMIGRAFFANEMLCNISISPRLHILPSENQPNEKIENSKNELLPGKTYAYEYLVGTKTGYTDTARHSLVTCAEKDGMKLICVVLHDEAPYQYEDTIALFNYGFNNFSKVNISESDSHYSIHESDVFNMKTSVFGDAAPLLSIDKDNAILLPKTISLEDLDSTISYEKGSTNQIATITYKYQGKILGTAAVTVFPSVIGNQFNTNSVITEEVSHNWVKDFLGNPIVILSLTLILLMIGILIFRLRTIRFKGTYYKIGQIKPHKIKGYKKPKNNIFFKK